MKQVNILCAAMVGAVIAAPAWGCSICRCGDPTFYRHAGRDQIDGSGATDPDTGGSIAYITPRILFDAGGGWVLRALAQIPLSDSGLNGTQDEKIVLNLGVTRLFKQ